MLGLIVLGFFPLNSFINTHKCLECVSSVHGASNTGIKFSLMSYSTCLINNVVHYMVFDTILKLRLGELIGAFSIPLLMGLTSALLSIGDCWSIQGVNTNNPRIGLIWLSQVSPFLYFYHDCELGFRFHKLQ